jgi:hypothetical protein
MGEFRIENGTSLDEAIGVALGYASMCWESPDGAGEFQSSKAAQCAQELAAAIRDGRVRDGQFGVKVSRWQPIGADGTIHTYAPPEPPVPTVQAHDTREVDGG